VDFEIDPAKAALNLKKHRVSFEEAASVFGDPLAFTFADPDHSTDEDRWLMFGLSHRARILAVVYTQRRGTYRIISGRLATRHERKIYEEG
jgi:uncharacterized DUF497 family protein